MKNVLGNVYKAVRRVHNMCSYHIGDYAGVMTYVEVRRRLTFATAYHEIRKARRREDFTEGVSKV